LRKGYEMKKAIMKASDWDADLKEKFDVVVEVTGKFASTINELIPLNAPTSQINIKLVEINAWVQHCFLDEHNRRRVENERTD